MAGVTVTEVSVAALTVALAVRLTEPIDAVMVAVSWEMPATRHPLTLAISQTQANEQN